MDIPFSDTRAMERTEPVEAADTGGSMGHMENLEPSRAQRGLSMVDFKCQGGSFLVGVAPHPHDASVLEMEHFSSQASEDFLQQDFVTRTDDGRFGYVLLVQKIAPGQSEAKFWQRHRFKILVLGGVICWGYSQWRSLQEERKQILSLVGLGKDVYGWVLSPVFEAMKQWLSISVTSSESGASLVSKEAHWTVVKKSPSIVGAFCLVVGCGLGAFAYRYFVKRPMNSVIGKLTQTYTKLHDEQKKMQDDLVKEIREHLRCKDEFEKLEARHKKLREDFDNAEKEQKRLEEGNRKLEVDLKQKSMNIQNLERQFTTKKDELEELDTKLKAEEQEANKFQQERDQVRRQCTNLEGDQECLERQLKEEKDARKSSDERASYYKEEERKARDEAKEKEESISKLKRRCDMLEVDKIKIKEDLDNKDKEQSKERIAAAETFAEASLLRQEKKELKEEADKLRDEKNSCKKSELTAAKLHIQSQHNYKNCLKDLEKLQNKAVVLERQKESEREKNDKLLSDLESQKHEVDKREKQLWQKRDELQQMQKKLQSVDEELRSKKRDLKHEQEKHQESKDKIDKINKHLDNEKAKSSRFKMQRDLLATEEQSFKCRKDAKDGMDRTYSFAFWFRLLFGGIACVALPALLLRDESTL